MLFPLSINNVKNIKKIKEKSCAVTRKLRDAAAVLFGLKSADDNYYKFE